VICNKHAVCPCYRAVCVSTALCDKSELIVSDRHLDGVHVPNERSMAQLHVQMEIISQLETQV